MADFDHRSPASVRQVQAGLLMHVAAFVGATVVLNGIIFGLGFPRDVDTATRLSWSPPGWVIGAIWVVLFAFYAVAHWLLLQRGDDGRRAAVWIRAIAVWDLAYPFLTNGFDQRISAWLNVVTLLFTVLVLLRVWQASRAAFGWLLPSLAWICFATVLTIVALQAVK